MPIYRSTLNTNKSNGTQKTNKPQKEKIPMDKTKKKFIINLCVILFSLLCFVLLLFKNPIKSCFLGMFGIFSYPLFLAIATFTTAGLTKRKYVVNKRYFIALCFSLFFIMIVIHLILARNASISSYGKYLAETFKIKSTGGGLVLSLITYPMVKYLTIVGAYVFTIIGATISIGFTIDAIVVARNVVEKKEKRESSFNFTEFKTLNENTNDVKVTFNHKQEDLKKKIAKQKLGIEQSESTILSSSMLINNISNKIPQSRPLSKKEYILTPPDIELPTPNKEKPINTRPKTDDVIVNSADDFYSDAKIIKTTELNSDNFKSEQNTIHTSTTSTFDNNSKFENIFSQKPPSNVMQSKEDISQSKIIDDEDKNDDVDNKNENIYDEDVDDEKEEVDTDIYDEDLEDLESDDYEDGIEESEDETEVNIDDKVLKEDKIDIPFARSVESEEIRPKEIMTENKNTFTKQSTAEPTNELGRPKKYHPEYVRPPVDLLNYVENVDVVTDEECNENIEKLEQVLEDFKIPAKVKAVQVGPAVTRYEIGMPTGISVKKVQMHSDDIAMALASNGSIRIEAPIPGKNAVGIEVPNRNVSSISLREIVESLDFQKRVNPLSFVLGKDINGTIQFCNLDKMPHLLVAGSTGSGKSVCLNTMLISMLYKSSPEDVRLILIDPKTVEFAVYANLPHLLTPHIITTKEQAINALNWAIKEMEYRYNLLQRNEVVNIKEYNNLPIVKDGQVDKLPFIVIVIDELNDLMLDTRRDMEERIMKLAQKSRAAGIHLVIATQRPSVDVITGTIKANLPSRIAFQLTNFADSKTVLDMSGAEKLLGRGDMLFKPNDMPEPRRVQGAYITSPEVSAVVKYIKSNNNPDFDDSAVKEITSTPENHQNANNDTNQTNFDPVMKDALRWFISSNQASITMIQRRFGAGYARAARIIDQMEQHGFISGQDGSKPRQVLISLEEFKKIFPDEN